MRKLFIFTFAMLAVMAFAIAPIYACGDKASTAKADVAKTDAKLVSSTDQAACSASKANAKLAGDKASCASKASNTNAKLAGDKATCASKTSTTNAKLVGDKATCASKTSTTNAKLAGDKASCAAACASKGASLATAEECATLCSKSSEVRVVSIEGMTCGGCEESIKATLAKAPGVLKVINVSYQDGIALVAVDKNKVCTTTMAKMVTDKGYKAEVIPAVAKTTADTKADAETM